MLVALLFPGMVTAFMVIMLRVEGFKPHMLIPFFFAFMAATPFIILGMTELSRATTIRIDNHLKC